MSLFGGKGRKDEGTPGKPREPAAPSPTRGEPETDMRGKRSDPNGGQVMANIGKSISIKGDLTGNEDLVVEGKVEGKIALPDNELTVGNNGNVSADVHAKSVVVIGKLRGNVSATEKIEVQASGSVDGDVRAPRLIIQEGAVLNGAVEMTKGSGSSSTPASTGASSGAPSPPLSSIGKTGSSKG